MTPNQSESFSSTDRTETRGEAHTPDLPWNRVGNYVVDVGSRTVCATYSSKSSQREADQERIERAERIFRCVNAHDRLVAINAELLEALQSFVFEFGDKTNSATVNKARAAIKKATA